MHSTDNSGKLNFNSYNINDQRLSDVNLSVDSDTNPSIVLPMYAGSMLAPKDRTQSQQAISIDISTLMQNDQSTKFDPLADMTEYDLQQFMYETQSFSDKNSNYSYY